jgi:hypothetical protein
MVFEEQMEDFVNAINKVYQQLKSVKQTNDKSYSVEKVRTKYPNAYMPWTIDEDNKLELLFCERKSIHELSKIFERNEGAIKSRIKKLELNEKYS